MDRRFFVSGISAATLGPVWGHAFGSGGISDRAKDLDLASIRFSWDDIPFSHAGSFLTINPSTESGAKRVRLQTVRRTAATYRYQTGAWSFELFEFELLKDGASVVYDVLATVEKLVLQAPGCEAMIAFTNPEELTLSVRGGMLRLHPLRAFSWKLRETVNVVRAFDSASGYVTTLTVQSQGTVALDTTLQGDAMLLSETHAGAMATATLSIEVEREDASAKLKPRVSTLAEWMRLCPADPNPLTMNATQTAWYLFWNLRVQPSGGYTRPTVMSSKRSLSSIWSWDNLFNAIAIGSADPELAWDQFRVILDHQLASGVLPDVVNDVGPIYGFRKPPIWAWAMVRLLPLTPASKRQGILGEIYPKLVAFHRWWFRERDLRGDGVPFYFNGNDSGWDNATIFASGNPVQSPDLLALLCVDAEHLAICADALKLPTEARHWNEHADRLTVLFHRHFVRGDQVVFHELTEHGLVEHRSTSLLTRLCIFLGARLQPSVRLRLLSELRDPRQFFAASGAASESLDSPLYDSNGYWRGPVWGPSTVLLCEGLIRCGAVELAATFAERYRTTVARRADFRENYDAVSGEGRYDSGMTWAAASFLLLGPVANRATTQVGKL